MTHWRRHDECVVETYDTYVDGDPEKGISGHGAHAVNATACGRLASHTSTTDDPAEADCPECVRIAFFVPRSLWFDNAEAMERFQEKWRLFTAQDDTRGRR